MAIQVKNDQDEKITDTLSKVSTYEDWPEKTRINETQIQPMSLQITEFSSKLSDYETRLDNTNIDTNIDDLKY